ncbi:MAG TPA: HIRAN domain-containing protein [Candidatus Acidoferrum sp.]|nr:HIRAN domain-containing protein [Candidatus Acidoferrum sp.]
MDIMSLIAVGAAAAAILGVAVASRARRSTMLSRERRDYIPLVQPAGGRAFRVVVAGARPRIVRKCSIGERLQLVPEPSNPSNKRTVGVFRRSGEQVGYLPRGHGLSKEIMDDRVSAVVDHISAVTLAKPIRSLVLKVTVRD